MSSRSLNVVGLVCSPRIALLLLTPLFVPASQSARAQQAPVIGYMYPPGGAAGQTVEVTLGGYEWTPDMQVFVHDPRIKLEIIAPPGPVIVPEPPYWFGKKARRGPFPMPRETKARLTIPADVPPGIVRWQAANANGATATGRFVVGDALEVLEIDGRKEPQVLAQLPVTVSGQIKKIEEVDGYRFTVGQAGLVTCAVTARAVGSDLDAVLEVHDESGRLVADAADTALDDTSLTFAGEPNRTYTISVYDLDFRGNRAYVYRLSITPGPRVVAAIPAAGKRGETRPVEFVGYGVATGAAKLESVTRDVAFAADPQASSFAYRLDTPHGVAPPISLLLSDVPETVAAEDVAGAPQPLAFPAAVTGVFQDRYGEDQYRVAGKKGDVWKIDLAGRRFDVPLDVTLAILDAEGKQLVQSDDVPGATDCQLEFTLPADGEYRLVVGDVSPNGGSRAAVYRLAVQAASPDFTLSAPELLNVPLGGKAKLVIPVKRSGGFNEPITVALAGLPEGVTAAGELVIAPGKPSLDIELSAAADAAALASLVTITGEAKIGEQSIRRAAGPLLVASTLKPPFSIDAEGKDDVTKWPRGTTFPAPVLIERDAGWNGEIMLEMASAQDRHRQGISGPELTVPPGVGRVLYPVYVPEWLETTRTSRMVVNGVAKVADPKGNLRYSLSRQKTRMGFLPVGALLKLSADVREFQAQDGQPFSIPLSLSRSAQLTEPVRLELRSGDESTALFTAEPQTLTATQTHTDFAVLAKRAANAAATAGEYELTIRATALQGGQRPVISETTVLVLFEQR
jgi:hypothetical protein